MTQEIHIMTLVSADPVTHRQQWRCDECDRVVEFSPFDRDNHYKVIVEGANTAAHAAVAVPADGIQLVGSGAVDDLGGGMKGLFGVK